jgi:diguanylate cyclase (GGDEF)-like protein/PAS domain S-box-containing protein
MKFRPRSFISGAIWPLASALAYWALATVALLLTQRDDGIATLWPSSGVLVAALLLTTPKRQPWFLFSGAAASFAANIAGGAAWPNALGYTVANVVEATIAARLILGAARGIDSFYTPSAIFRFAGASLVAATVSGLIASATLAISAGGFSFPSLVSWISTVGLGIMVVVPVIINTAYGLQRGTRKFPRWRQTIIALAAVATTTAFVFGQSSYPLLFLPVVAVVFATYLGGPSAAASSIILIVLIGTIGTVMGTGPSNLIRGGTVFSSILFFQFFVFVNILAALPLAALQYTRRRDAETITRDKRWLEMSERVAKVGHWRLDLRTQALFWSDEVFKIHGLEPGNLPSLDGGIDYYHTEDREMVQRCLDDAVAASKAFEFEARLVRADGAVRYVVSRGEVEQGPNGKATAIFGIFQDITERALKAIDLADAKQKAEERVSDAIQLAMTDPLTGIGNRRWVTEMLASELERAEREQRKLSIALLDIDHFKSINDRLGHSAGDIVLKDVAQICANAVRRSDFVGRLGGEEFLIVLPGADTTTAMIVAERVRSSLEANIWPSDGPERVTASLGIATFSTGTGVEHFLREADEALYCAKAEGRNRLHFAA